MHASMCACACMYVCTYVYVCMSASVYVYSVCACTHDACMFVCVCIYLGLFVCMCACTIFCSLQITCVHHSANSPPLMLKKFIYCCPDTQQYSAVEQDSGINIDTYINTWTSTGASRNDTSKNYQVPLLELAYRLHQCDTSIDSLSFHFDSRKKHCSVESSNSGVGWCHVLNDVDNYCVHGLLYKNWTDLCQ